MKQTTEEVVV